MQTPNPDDLNLERNRISCIGRALIRTRGQQKKAAEFLGTSPRVLNYLIVHHGLRPLIDIGRGATLDEEAARAALATFLDGYVSIIDPAPEKLGRTRPPMHELHEMTIGQKLKMLTATPNGRRALDAIVDRVLDDGARKAGGA